MRVTFLGSGTSTGVPLIGCDCEVCRSADARDRRLRPSIRMEWPGASVLVDTATDLRAQALAREVGRVDAVLYTHAHADHVLGLDELRTFNWRQGAPIPAYGSAATLEDLSRTFWYVFESVQVGGGKPAVERCVVEGPFELLGRRVVPVPVMHGRLAILGYRVGGFAYLTDASLIPESSYALLRGLDALVLAAPRERPHPTHMHVARALEEARRISPRRTLLTHIGHDLLHSRVSAGLPEGVGLAYDGLVLEIDDRDEVAL
ncbi:MAG: MBL fold metallo-hydrolase [Acidobacteriia bacterium]|nr:MBL fold metallo-hydrolase [Terriglobia bacterium]